MWGFQSLHFGACEVDHDLLEALPFCVLAEKKVRV